MNALYDVMTDHIYAIENIILERNNRIAELEGLLACYEAGRMAADSAEDDIQFLVNLLRVPDLRDMSGSDVFELMINARHIAGNYWMFEGDVEALRVAPKVHVVETGITSGHGDMSFDEFLDHAIAVFPETDFSSEPPAWRMLSPS